MHDGKLCSCMQERGEVEREMVFVLSKLLNGICPSRALFRSERECLDKRVKRDI